MRSRRQPSLDRHGGWEGRDANRCERHGTVSGAPKDRRLRGGSGIKQFQTIVFNDLVTAIGKVAAKK